MRGFGACPRGETVKLFSAPLAAISHWLLDRRNIDLAWLAANVGTSITTLAVMSKKYDPDVVFGEYGNGWANAA
jgi:hypothetical protein